MAPKRRRRAQTPEAEPVSALVLLSVPDLHLIDVPVLVSAVPALQTAEQAAGELQLDLTDLATGQQSAVQFQPAAKLHGWSVTGDGSVQEMASRFELPTAELLRNTFRLAKAAGALPRVELLTGLVPAAPVTVLCNLQPELSAQQTVARFTGAEHWEATLEVSCTCDPASLLYSSFML